MASLDDVAAIIAELPDVLDGERHGTRTWFVNGKGFAWHRPFSKADLRRFGEADPPAGPILAAQRGALLTSLAQDSSKQVRLLAGTGKGSLATLPLVVRTADLSDKEAVLAAGHPGVFTIPHFDGYAAVLTQLDVVSDRVLRELVVDGWLAYAPPALARRYLGQGPG